MVQSACDKAGVSLHTGWPEPSMTEEKPIWTDEDKIRFLIEEKNAKIIRVSEELAAIGRKVTGLEVPV